MLGRLRQCLGVDKQSPDGEPNLDAGALGGFRGCFGHQGLAFRRCSAPAFGCQTRYHRSGAGVPGADLAAGPAGEVAARAAAGPRGAPQRIAKMDRHREAVTKCHMIAVVIERVLRVRFFMACRGRAVRVVASVAAGSYLLAAFQSQ